ncbi:MAG: CoA transferase, partial [Dehalococcoidia bacterium]|nr:CoA transferase [Dehalococcoidia bacterium]
GAEVIKVEEPGVGDEARRLEPFLDDLPGPERSGLFLYLNANKLGVTLNLNIPTGRKIFRELVRDADILVENHPPSFFSDLGLDYESLRELDPRLIVASITPFGCSGPYRDYRAYDLNTYHIGGFGYPGGSPEPGTTPLKAGGRQADFVAAANGAVGAMIALYGQRATGRGQHLDVSTMECIASMQETWVEKFTYLGLENLRLGRRSIGPGDIFPCKDGFIQYFAIEEAQWIRFVEVMGNPDWAHSELFKDRDSRTQYWDALKPLITEWTMERTKEEIVQSCQANRVPFAPVNNMADLANSQHLTARQFFVEIDHPEAGRIRYPSSPCKLEKTPWQVIRPAPLLGQHNEEIYCHRLGYGREDLAKFAQAGII